MRISLAVSLTLLGYPALSDEMAFSAGSDAAVAKLILTQLQYRSFDDNVEYCGYIGIDAAGRTIAGKPTSGTWDSCLPIAGPELEVVTASYHTHGAYSPRYPAETPSVIDFEADEDEGINGFVSTPGGRFWFIDTTDNLISQICGLGCLPADPTFVRDPNAAIAQSYTYDELLDFFENEWQVNP